MVKKIAHSTVLRQKIAELKREKSILDKESSAGYRQIDEVYRLEHRKNIEADRVCRKKRLEAKKRFDKQINRINKQRIDAALQAEKQLKQQLRLNQVARQESISPIWKVVNAANLKIRGCNSRLETAKRELASLEIAAALKKVKADIKSGNLRELSAQTALPLNEALLVFKFVDVCEAGTIPSQRNGFNGCRAKKLGRAVIALKIPVDAKRVKAEFSSDHKCRASKAEVLGVIKTNVRWNKKLTLFSWWRPTFQYIIGKEVKPDHFDGDKDIECSNGIHFYPTALQALKAGGMM